ncbi:MAG: hypothetical protein JWN34_5389 [Bryobacterales bacterium]|nr:hypothetical protein [Bryobacterales bacterium]
MFFRRAVVKITTFDDRLGAARSAGFRTDSVGGGKTRIERNGIAALVEAGDGGMPRVTSRAGVVMGDEIGTLTDSGYQKFFVTPHGKRMPAVASELRAIHDFQEDLREAMGLISLYNESLGTVSNQYIYDRVEGRDKGTYDKPWETAKV